MSQETFSYQQLFDFTKFILQKIGCSEEHAATSAKVLLSADLRGVDSHGVARLSGYVRLWEVKRINTDPILKIIHETPSTAVVDGDSARWRSGSCERGDRGGEGDGVVLDAGIGRRGQGGGGGVGGDGFDE